MRVQEQPVIRRKKLEQLITEFVHKRDIMRYLVQKKVENNKAFRWLKQMRFYFNPKVVAQFLLFNNV